MVNSRINALQSQLKEKKHSAFLIEDPTDIFYLCGIKVSTGLLLIGLKYAYLIVDGRYFESCSKTAPIPVFLLSDKEILRLFKTLDSQTLAFDANFTSYARYESLEKIFDVPLIPLYDFVMSLRLYKEPNELLKIKKSISFLKEGYEYLKNSLKEGISEKQLSSLFHVFCLERDLKTSFEPIVAFGLNTAYPHHHSGNTTLSEGDIVLFDLGIESEEYASDMTRTFFFRTIQPSLKAIYEVVYEAQTEAIKMCRPGVLLKDLDLKAREAMRKSDLENYFVHTLGHGIGLKVHEQPRISHTGMDKDVVLKEGMIITIEPGLYLPDLGGVRIEDMILITENGCEILTNSIEKKLCL